MEEDPLIVAFNNALNTSFQLGRAVQRAETANVEYQQMLMQSQAATQACLDLFNKPATATEIN